MIDSIDLIVKNIKYLDIKYLKSLGICVDTYNYDKYKYTRNRYKKENPTFLNYDYGYEFYYKFTSFKYSMKQKYLLIFTHPNEILQKDVVTLTDKEEYKQIVSKRVAEILNTKQTIPKEVSRVDYKVDIKMDSKEMLKEYIGLLNKHDRKYRYMKKKRNYNSSTYLTNNYGQNCFNFYDKEEEQITNRGSHNKKYENVLRLEVQNKNPKIKALLKNEGIEPILDNYYSKEGMERNFFDIIAPYLYKGDYYKMKQAREIINKSNYSPKWKSKLKGFLKAVAINGGVKATYNKKYCCEDTGKEYIKKLNDLGINPITLDDNSPYNKLDNLVKLARNIVETECYK